MKRWVLLTAVLTALRVTAAEAPKVTFGSLLAEIGARGLDASLASPGYHLLQASSHDRRKNDPWDAATWHSNEDYGQFIRTEMNQGRREWVILEDSGPGAIVRWWTPLLAEKDKQIVRFYFDGSPTPSLEANYNDLLSGKGFAKPPYAYVAWNERDLHNQLKREYKAQRGVGADLFLPIPYAKGCKVTLDSKPFYYVINYRHYDAGAVVETLSKAILDGSAEQLAQHAKPLLDPWDKPATLATKPLPAGETTQVELAQGPAQVVRIDVQIDPAEAPQALRSLVLEASFDDEATVWCPLGEFFGAGAHLSDVRDYHRSATADGHLTSQWVMPYARSGRVTLRNLSAQPLHAGLEARTTGRPFGANDLHFHATWHAQNAMKTRPISDWNYLDIKGQGLYVGDSLTVFSPDKAWYGEGDERIYVDGDTFPAHIGTGTEDYYGMAWGMADFLSTPFQSMPQRDIADRGDWRGYTTTSRLRQLDAIPFQTALKVDMENWNWADTQVDYAVGCFWYARPGATSNREPQPKEAALALREPPPDPRKYAIAGALEFEDMKPAATSDGLRVSTQNGGLLEGAWSHGTHLWLQGTKVGDWAEFDLPADGAGARAVTVYATKSYDYGILRFSVNGQPAGKDWDGYDAQAKASGPIELGTFAPNDGKLRLRVEVVGANAAAKGEKYYFGLDAVVIAPAKP